MKNNFFNNNLSLEKDLKDKIKETYDNSDTCYKGNF